MLRRTVALVATALLAASLAGCTEDDAKGAEDEVPVDGKLDSFQRPTDHGPIAFATNAESTLTATARHHTWTFSLPGQARVHLYTHPSLTSRQMVDTVLYLYKRGPTGWGSYIARNDDAGDVFSSLTRDLGPGEYRLLVKGYLASTRGPFAVTVECDGAGCAPAPSCLFGATFGDLLAGTGYTITGDRELHVGDWQSALDQQRIVVAVQQSAHTDVMTVEQAFAAVDGNVIRRVDLYDEAGGRAFVAFEYGAGDNSYGAIFTAGTTTRLASIVDLTYYDCAFAP